MKLSFLTTACLAGLFLAANAGATSFYLGATLTSSQEVSPQTFSSGSGTGEIDVSDDGNSAFVLLFVSGLAGQVTNGTGIYGPASPGFVGGFVYGLPVPFPSFNSGFLSGEFSLPGGFEGQTFADLMSGQLYFNVFSNADTSFFEGSECAGPCPVATSLSPSFQEIRGQILQTAGPVLTPEPAAAGLAGIGLAAIGLALSRRKSISRP